MVHLHSPTVSCNCALNSERLDVTVSSLRCSEVEFCFACFFIHAGSSLALMAAMLLAT